MGKKKNLGYALEVEPEPADDDIELSAPPRPGSPSVDAGPRRLPGADEATPTDAGRTAAPTGPSSPPLVAAAATAAAATAAENEQQAAGSSHLDIPAGGEGDTDSFYEINFDDEDEEADAMAPPPVGIVVEARDDRKAKPPQAGSPPALGPFSEPGPAARRLSGGSVGSGGSRRQSTSDGVWPPREGGDEPPFQEISVGSGSRRTSQALEKHEEGFTEQVLCFKKEEPLYATQRTFYVTDFVSNFPSFVLGFSLIMPIVFLILAVTRPATFDTDPRQFFNRRHPLYKGDEALGAAKADWASLRQQGLYEGVARTIPKYRITLQFIGKNGTWTPEGNVNQYSNETWSVNATNTTTDQEPANLLQEHTLRYIQSVETMIAGSWKYPVLCWTNNKKFKISQPSYPQCAPMASVTTYFFPGSLSSAADGGTDFQFNGRGDYYQQPVHLVMGTVKQSPLWPWFFDAQMSTNPTVYRSSILRTQITLGYPLMRYGEEISLEEYNLIIDEFLREILANVSTLDHPEVLLTIGADRLEEAAANGVLISQIQITAVAIGIVFAIILLHLRGLILPAAAAAQIVMTFLAAYWIYTFTEANLQLSLFAGMSLLVTLTLNVNGVLITIETFEESGRFGPTGRLGSMTMNQRVAYTYQKAVLGNLASRVAAILSVACLTLTPIPALRGFSIILLMTFGIDAYMFTLVFPPALVFYQKHFSKRRNNVQRERRNLKPLIGPRKRRRHPLMIKLLECEEAVKKLYGQNTTAETKMILDEGGGIFDEELETQHMKMERSMSVGHLKATRSQSVIEDTGAPVPKKATYDSPRLVPLVSIFKLPEKVSNIKIARELIDGALASYNRRLAGKTLQTFDEGGVLPSPYVDEDGNVGGIESDVIVIQYRDKWEYMGRFIGTVRYDEYGASFAERVSNTVLNRNLVADALIAGPSHHPMVPADSIPKSQAFCHKKCLPLWQRPWRKAMDRDERDADYLNTFVPHLGIGWLPWFFRKKWVPIIFTLRFILTLIYLVGVVTSITYASRIRPTSDPLQLLTNPPAALELHPAFTKLFPVNSHCDYCSAWQQQESNFPFYQLLDLQRCAYQGYGLQMHSYMDRCNVCMGNNTCLDCESRPFGVSDFDSCGFCRAERNELFNRCLQCEHGQLDGNYGCWYCNQSQGAMYRAGASCSVYCSDTTCPPSHGTCNPWTGICECHQSYEKGYFADDPALASFSIPAISREYCSLCTSGFYPTVASGSPIACRYECDPELHSGAPCMCVKGRCTGCPRTRMGVACDVDRSSTCYKGTIDSVTLECNCPDTNLDPLHCRYHANCSYRGELFTSSEAAVANKCICRGQWRGATCRWCRCYNGGTCNEDGTCNCPPGYAGADCTACVNSCAAHGTCPLQWPAKFYTNLTQCVAVLCNKTAVENDIICAACQLTGTQIECQNQTVQEDCESHHLSCYWVPKQLAPSVPSPPTPLPTETPYYHPPTEFLLKPTTSPTTTVTLTKTASHTFSESFHPDGHCYQSVLEEHYYKCTYCNGAWYGEDCGVCNNTAPGAYCNPLGEIIGCDGRATGLKQTVKVVDRCGVCNGDGECYGCDGMRGSDAAVDKCGVCGGNNQCLSTSSSDTTDPSSYSIETNRIEFAWGLVPPEVENNNGTAGLYLTDPAFNITDTAFQVFLLAQSLRFLNETEHLDVSRSSCVWLDFVFWLQANSTKTLYGQQFPRIGFPYTHDPAEPYAFHTLAYLFAREENRFSDFGFSHADIEVTVHNWYPPHVTPPPLNLSSGTQAPPTPAPANGTTLPPEGLVATTETTNITLRWMRWVFYSHPENSTTEEQIIDQYHHFDAIRREMQGDPANRGRIITISRSWSDLLAILSSLRIAAYALATSLVMLTGLMSIMTCSPMIVVLAVLCVGCTAAGTLALFYLLGKPLGPVQIAAICLSTAYASDHIIHQAYDYSLRLPNHSQDVVAGSFFLKTAMKDALARAGPCCLVSGVSASIAAFTVAFSSLRVFSETGIAIIFSNVTSMVMSLVLFPAVLSVVGPRRAYNFWQFRIIVACVFTTSGAIIIGALAGAGVFPAITSGYLEF